MALRKGLEAMSDAGLLEVLLSEDYRPEARDIAVTLLRARFAHLGWLAELEAQEVARAVIAALAERSDRCHLCVSAPAIAERYPFLLCRRIVDGKDVAMLAAGLILPGAHYVRRARYDVLPLMLNLCRACADERRGEITKELCIEHPLAELLQKMFGFTEIKWPSELEDEQRSDGGPPRLAPGARVLTTAGMGVIRRVTPAGQAVIDLDTGGTIVQDVTRIVAPPLD